MGKYIRLETALRRVVTIEGKEMVLAISAKGVSLRRLGARRSTALPVSWAELARDGGSLEQAELKKRPLLAAACKQEDRS